MGRSGMLSLLVYLVVLLGRNTQIFAPLKNHVCTLILDALEVSSENV